MEEAEVKNEMLNSNFSLDEVREAMREISNWKSAGPDKIQNIWVKKLTSTHVQLVRL